MIGMTNCLTACFTLIFQKATPARSVTPPQSTAPSAPPPPTSTLYSTIVHDTGSSVSVVL